MLADRWLEEALVLSLLNEGGCQSQIIGESAVEFSGLDSIRTVDWFFFPVVVSDDLVIVSFYHLLYGNHAYWDAEGIAQEVAHHLQRKLLSFDCPVGILVSTSKWASRSH